MLESTIIEFYGRLQFPGSYSIDDIKYHSPAPTNPFLATIDQHIPELARVIDIGCGAGYISNLMASNHPLSQFLGIDASDAFVYAENFAVKNNIKNIVYKKANILTYQDDTKYDVVICQGVIHHIPEFKQAIQTIKSLVADHGTLILGLYHPTGKILKKFIKLKYSSKILEQDQEDVPFELTFTKHTIKQYFSEFEFVEQYPTNPVINFITQPLQHSTNGGLVTYILKKT